MRIFYFNTKLAWVAAACCLYALIAMVAVALGEKGGPGRIRIGYGPEFVTIEGRLRELKEEPDRLVLTVEAEPGTEMILGPDGEALTELPSDLEVRFVAPGNGPRVPKISLLSGPIEPRRHAGGRIEIGSRFYVVKVSRDRIRINNPPPRPPDNRKPPGRQQPGEGRPGDRLRQRQGGEPPPPGPGNREKPPGPGERRPFDPPGR